jgi:AbrB family looped-hinge helix DNA binding protein
MPFLAAHSRFRPSPTFRVAVNRQGRIVIPAGMRHALGIEPGSTLEASVEGGRLVLRTAREAEERLWASFSRAAKGRELSRELIAERRQEVRREKKKR